VGQRRVHGRLENHSYRVKPRSTDCVHDNDQVTSVPPVRPGINVGEVGAQIVYRLENTLTSVVDPARGRSANNRQRIPQLRYLLTVLERRHSRPAERIEIDDRRDCQNLVRERQCHNPTRSRRASLLSSQKATAASRQPGASRGKSFACGSALSQIETRRPTGRFHLVPSRPGLETFGTIHSVAHGKNERYNNRRAQ
jgi:hypothetical protein